MFGSIDYLILVGVIYCIYTDIKFKKIKNYITFPMMLIGFVYNIYKYGLTGAIFSIKGLFICGVLAIILASCNGLGMGDVKLFMGIGAIKGSGFSLDVLFLSFIISIIFSIILNPKKFIQAIKNLIQIIKSIIYTKKMPYLETTKSAITITFATYIFLGLVGAYISGGDLICNLLLIK